MSKRTKQVTRGTTWRKKSRASHLIVLPSGNTARLRPVSLDTLVLSGEMPDVLSTLAAQTLFADVDFEDIAEEGKVSKGYVDLINRIVPAAFAEPRVVDEPQGSDEIALSDIDWGDKVVVFQLALLPTDAVEKFRQEQDGDVEDVSDGDDVAEQTEQAPENI